MEPTASPSGRACAETRKRSPRSMAWRTAWMSSSCCIAVDRGLLIPLASSRSSLLPVALAAEQFIDARLHLVGTVDVKREIRNAARAHAFVQFVPDVAPRGHQTVNGVLFFFGAAIHGDIDKSGLPARIKNDLSDISKADAGIG